MRLKEIIRNPNFYFPVFFLFLFFYYLLVFDSYAYYHNYQPLFLFDKIYLKKFLLYPGGPSDLITQFFFQFFSINLLGAFFLSSLSVSIFIIVYKSIKKIVGFKYSLILSFLPVALLLFIQNRYNYPLVITFKYLFASIFFLIYAKISNRYKVFIIPLSFLIYYILGGWVYLFYIVLCMAHELLFSQKRRKYIYAVLNSLAYLIYPYIAARYLFMITPKEAYLYIVPDGLYDWPFNFKPDLYFDLFFLSLPLLQIGLFIYLKYTKAKKEERKIKKRKSLFIVTYHNLTQSIFIVLIGILILIFSFNPQEKKRLEIDYLAEKGRWEDLLNLSLKTEEYDFLINFNVNRALYHTGQLLDNLFGYPQIRGADGLFLENAPRQVSTLATDLYFDLGYINAAQGLAHEGYMIFGYNTRMLKRIVVANIINEKYIAAKKYLDLLNKSIMHKKWVKHYRNYLSDESLTKSDSLIQLKRKLTPKFDFFISIGGEADKDLIGLLQENGDNIMAFEYLMAYYLLAGRLEDVMEHLDQFKKLGYRKYPRHIEEALLANRFDHPLENVEIDYNIDQQTIDRFEQFNSILYSYKNKEEAKEALSEGFFHTYWYYILYIEPEEANPE